LRLKYFGKGLASFAREEKRGREGDISEKDKSGLYDSGNRTIRRKGGDRRRGEDYEFGAVSFSPSRKHRNYREGRGGDLSLLKEVSID